MGKRVISTLLWGAAAVVLPLGLVLLTLPWPIPLAWSDPASTSFMRYRVGEARARGEDAELRHEWVPLENISSELVRAVVLAEDGRFREHAGIDWLALAEEVEYDGGRPFSPFSAEDRAALVRALRFGWEHRDEVRGRSTITQQLAKNLYFTPDRSFGRKLAEFVVAKRLERFLSKDRILELYLNTVELGPGIFGVEAASRAYFDTGAGDLSRRQAASLAATLPHPLTSNPADRPGRMAWRRDRILDRMAGGGGGGGAVPVAPEIPAAPPELPPAEPPVGDAPAADVVAEPTADSQDVALPGAGPVGEPRDPPPSPPFGDSTPRPDTTSRATEVS